MWSMVIDEISGDVSSLMSPSLQCPTAWYPLFKSLWFTATHAKKDVMAPTNRKENCYLKYQLMICNKHHINYYIFHHI